MNSPLNKIKYRLVLIVLCSFICLAGILFYRFEVSTLKKQKTEELKVVSEIKNNQLSNWYSDELFDAATIARNFTLINFLEAYLQTPNGNNKANLLQLLDAFRIEHDYSLIALTDSAGNILLYSSIDTCILKNNISRKQREYIGTNSSFSNNLFYDPCSGKLQINFISAFNSQLNIPDL